MKMSIFDLNLGEEFFIKLRGDADFLTEPAAIIMRSLVKPKDEDSYKYCVFGWKNKPKHNSRANPWALRDIKELQNDMIEILGINKDQIEVCEKYNEYRCGWWAELKYYDVELIQPPVIMPDQKCIGCNKPAPHSKPNYNKDYACKSCATLVDIYIWT